MTRADRSASTASKGRADPGTASKARSAPERLKRAPRLSERALLAAVLDLAHRLGWKTAHFHDSRRQVKPGVFVGDAAATGWPDLVLVPPPRTERAVMFRELKGDGGRVSPEQRRWLDALWVAGEDARIWTADDWRDGTIERELHVVVTYRGGRT